MRTRRDALEDEVQRMRWLLEHGGLSGTEAETTRVKIAELDAEREAVREQHRSGLRAYHESFHPVWGQTMKTGCARVAGALEWGPGVLFSCSSKP